jgi:hypothetical protein
MTAPLPPKVTSPSVEPPLTRMSNELASLRASVGKLTRTQSALILNVKALADQVQLLSDMVQHMSKTMRPGAVEEEARRQLH